MSRNGTNFLRVLPWALLFIGFPALLFGIAAVFIGTHVESGVEAKNALVQSGEIDPVDAVVTRKKVSKKRETSGGTTTTTKKYGIALKVDEAKSIGRTVNRTDYDAVQEGDVYDAYPIDGGYFIPRFDSQTQTTVKWIILVVSSLPVLAAIGLLIGRKLLPASQSIPRRPAPS